jgi:hypothetical protein
MINQRNNSKTPNRGNYSTNNHKKYPKKEDRIPTRDELFTGWKVPHIAVFYNIAFFKLAGYVNHLLGNPFEDSKNDLEANLNSFLNNAHLPENDRIFLKLREYLWKGYATDPNSSGNELTDEDRTLIVDMLRKLNEIRNFHSHYWHDNSVLTVSKELKKNIETLHDNAKNTLLATHSKEVAKYEISLKEKPLFSSHDGNSFISQKGRIFFLSLFLTRGEMARLLQQCNDFKYTTKPEEKIANLVYRHYTHRDGAARQHYGQEENVLKTLPPEERKDILAARQAYKLISYLNDTPPVSYDTNLFPLFLDENTQVLNAEDLIKFCKKNNFWNDLSIKPLSIEKSVPEGQISDGIMIEKEFYLDISLEGFNIYLSQTTLHRLILDSLRRNDGGKLVLEKLRQFIEERRYLDNLIKYEEAREAHVAKGETSIEQEFDQYYRFKLRSNEKHHELMGHWLKKIDYIDPHRFTVEKLEKFTDTILTTPIEVNYYDFYFKDEEKPRASDQFVSFAVNYLIDFGVVPNWNWHYERFSPKMEVKEIKNVTREVLINKRRTKFSATKPTLTQEEENEDNSSEWRLSIKDGQALVGIYTDETEEYKQAGKPPKYKFALGHRAIKNLLITHLGVSQVTDINNFFDDIIDDIKMIKEKKGTIESLKILTKKEIPMSFLVTAKATKSLDTNQLRERAIRRIDRLIGDMKDILPHGDEKPKVRLKRAEKNRRIMECYNFFDWNYDDSTEYKFLRKDEYQQMSVYHYCLDKRWDKKINEKTFNFIKNSLDGTLRRKLESMTNNYGRLDITIDKLKSGDKDQDTKDRKVFLEVLNNSHPIEKMEYFFLIESIVKHTPTEIIDVLEKSNSLDDLLQNVCEMTTELLEGWRGLIPMLKGKHLKNIIDKLDISSYQDPQLADHIPFDVHPMLVLRKYFKNELDNANREGMPNNAQFSLSAKIWKNKSLRKGTREEHYNTETYLKQHNISTNAAKIQRKIIGENNELITQDVLLWMMAKKYIKATSAAYRGFITDGRSEGQWNISNLRQTEIQKVFKDVGEYKEITLKIKFHQLDDYLLVESKPVIELAIKQVMMRYKYLENKNDPRLANMNINTTKHGFCVPYEEVFKEIQRVYNDSIHCVGELLKWEKDIINRMTLEERTGFGNNKLSDQKQHINFVEVCSKTDLDDTEKETLRAIRNTAFHVKIPDGWAYWQKEIKGKTFKNLFNYTDKTKKSYEITSDA